jgi:hypothetical protein
VNIVDTAIARLAQQFQGKTRLVAVLTALIEPAVELDAVLTSLITQRTIYAATGYLLDEIGKIVGQTRGGLNDDSYRRYILARIAANKSRGFVEELITIARLILNDDGVRIVVEQYQTASVVVTLEDKAVSSALADIIIGFLRESVAAGVKLELHSSVAAPENTFTLDAITIAQGLSDNPVFAFGAGGSGYDAVVAYADFATAATLQFIEDSGAPGAGVLDESDPLNIIFTFNGGVTDSDDFEAAVAASNYLRMYQAATTGTVVFSAGVEPAGDEFGPLAFDVTVGGTMSDARE